ncbi:MAG: hypothetical protein ACTSQP_24750 [Promethearchaeota archaeon]
MLSVIVRFNILLIILIMKKFYSFTIWGVYDDKFYHSFASGMIENIQSYKLNYYHYFLKIIYDIFGNNILLGRILNIILSSVFVYMFSLILLYIIKNNKNKGKILLSSTIFYAFNPYIAIYSCFDLKDWIIAILYGIIIIAIFNYYYNFKYRIINFVLILILIFLINNFRKGLGVISLFLAFVFFMPFKFEKKKLNLIFLFSLCFLLLIIFVFNFIKIDLKEYYEIFKFQRNIFFSQNLEIRKYLTIKNFYDLPKLPLSIIVYILSPFPSLDFSYNRIIINYGGWFKLFEQLVVLLGFFQLIRKFKINNIEIFILVPIIILALMNPTNYRQSIFILPYFYIFGFFFLNEKWKKARIKKLIIAVAIIFIIILDILGILF